MLSLSFLLCAEHDGTIEQPDKTLGTGSRLAWPKPCACHNSNVSFVLDRDYASHNLPQPHQTHCATLNTFG